MNPHEPDWVRQISTQLDEEIRQIDGHTASRLNRVRQNALDQALGRRQRRSWLRPLYAFASCAALALALSVVWRVPETPLPPAPVPAVDDFELLAGAEDLELIENLEFYAWLEQQSLDG